MTTSITRHPDAATLLAYAAGTLAEPLAAAIAAHESMCSVCRQEIKTMEMVGAELLAALPQDTPGRRVPKRPQDIPAEQETAAKPARDGLLPPVLAAHYGLTAADIPWRWLGPGVWHHQLPLSAGTTGDLRLLKIGAGRAMPVHGHRGSELTLVLDGAYSDRVGGYRRGDVQDVDGDIEHQPIADAEMGCICLIASERPARFGGLVGRVMQLWTGM